MSILLGFSQLGSGTWICLAPKDFFPSNPTNLSKEGQPQERGLCCMDFSPSARTKKRPMTSQQDQPCHSSSLLTPWSRSNQHELTQATQFDNTLWNHIIPSILWTALFSHFTVSGTQCVFPSVKCNAAELLFPPPML